jgi:acetyl esterase/lipase
MPSPEMAAVLHSLRTNPPQFSDDVDTARLAIDTLMGATPLAPGATTEAVRVVGRHGLWVRPADADPSRAVLYLHGGGYRIGSPQAYRGFVSHLAVAAGVPFLLIDYRLAPEHPFPAAVVDAVGSYRWLLAQGYDAGRVAVAGDSAGGGLVVATLLAARMGKLPQPAAAVCLSPWVDLTVTAASYTRNAATDPFFSARQATDSAADYLAGDLPHEPLASPIFADLGGLAPLLVHAADCEVLSDDAVTLAARVHAAGGTVQAELWPEMVHVWHSMTPGVPEAADAVAKVAAFLHDRWG